MYQLDNNSIMKKIFIFLGLAVAFSSCEDEVAFNETTLQAKINYQHIRFDHHEAFVENGNLLIKGGTETDSIEINIPNYTFGTRYELSNGNFSVNFKTVSENSDTLIFHTNSDLDGYVFLNAVEDQTPGSISGSFAFDMEMEDFGDIGLNTSIRFHDGVMLNIPIHNNAPEVIEDEEVAEE